MNKKLFVSIIAVVALVAVFATLFVGCNPLKWESVGGGEPNADVESNGGYFVKQGKYVYFINGYDTAETIPSEDESNTIILSNNRKQSDVAMQTTQPEFLGAIIVSGGSDNANIRYDILSSVMAYTGLSVDRISICPIQE